ncbi:rCG37955 [Rattus norvegicus]|uniref:RCG37955 n=1 Tax=Rattus norvegicus TaxID=10116 RepID=A6K630_RAT|nr:rCG37955 [Rattus norvegicus]
MGYFGQHLKIHALLNWLRTPPERFRLRVFKAFESLAIFEKSDC